MTNSASKIHSHSYVCYTADIMHLTLLPNYIHKFQPMVFRKIRNTIFVQAIVIMRTNVYIYSLIIYHLFIHYSILTTVANSNIFCSKLNSKFSLPIGYNFTVRLIDNVHVHAEHLCQPLQRRNVHWPYLRTAPGH